MKPMDRYQRRNPQTALETPHHFTSTIDKHGGVIANSAYILSHKYYLQYSLSTLT